MNIVAPFTGVIVELALLYRRNTGGFGYTNGELNELR